MYTVEIGGTATVYDFPVEVCVCFVDTRAHYMSHAHHTSACFLPPQFEPYVIAKREQLPSYDERFRGMRLTVCVMKNHHYLLPHTHTGYAYNKLSYFYYLHMLGFQFHVHPWAYLVHMPHHEQHHRKEQLEHNNYKYKIVRVCGGYLRTLYVGPNKARNTQMGDIFKGEMRELMHAQTYKPVIAEQPFPLGTRAVYDMSA